MANIMDLPDDDILGILSFLPFSSLFEAKDVCQRWSRLAKVTEIKQLTSWCILSCPARLPSSSTKKLSRINSFRKEFARSGSLRKAISSASSSSKGAFPKSDNFHVVMFDPSTRKWLKVENPFGYKGPCASSSRELLWVPSTAGYSGLVCVFEWEEESCHNTNTFWVGNPITNDWQCIAGPSPWRGLHQLVVDPVTKDYKIICIRWELLTSAEVPTGIWRAAIYDSKDGKWRYGAHWNVPEPPTGKPYCLSSRTHTASDKMMYLMMHRAGTSTWETYVEIQILGYDIQKDEFKFVTPLTRIDQLQDYFEPISCRDWPVHLVLKPDELTNPSGNARPVEPTAAQSTSDQPAYPSCPVLLVTCSTRNEGETRFHKICHSIVNAIKGRPRAFHKEFLNQLCIYEFNPTSGAWDVKEKSSSKVTGRFYSKDRVFHCAGERLEHLYCAHVDKYQSLVLYNSTKDNYSNWSRVTPLGDEYGGWIAKNFHSIGSFVPRLDATPGKLKDGSAKDSLQALSQKPMVSEPQNFLRLESTVLDATPSANDCLQAITLHNPIASEPEEFPLS